MSAEQCRFIEKCPMYPRFKNEFGLRIYKRTYCESDQHVHCHRFKHASEGKMPPPELLPNGKMMARG